MSFVTGLITWSRAAKRDSVGRDSGRQTVAGKGWLTIRSLSGLQECMCVIYSIGLWSKVKTSTGVIPEIKSV